MAARFRIVILDRPDVGTYRVLFWADVPSARQPFYARPGIVSAWKGAIAADNTALVNGEVAERVREFSAVGLTLAEAQAQAQILWQQFQDEITNDNKWLRYGTTWDGVSWTADGVA